MQGASIYAFFLPLNIICDANLVDFEQVKFHKLKPEKLSMLFFYLLSFLNIIHLFDISSLVKSIFLYHWILNNVFESSI